MLGFLFKKKEVPAPTRQPPRPARREKKKKAAVPRPAPLMEEKLLDMSAVTRSSAAMINSIKEAINQLSSSVSSKQDIEKILKEISVSKESILAAVDKIPDNDDIIQLLVSQITEPLKEFISTRVSARPQPVVVGRSASTFPALTPVEETELEGVVSDMKSKLSLLSQRHLRIINVLAQNRNLWVDYEQIGDQCHPVLTGSCIRGYVSDLLNTYKLPIEKKAFGRQVKIRLSETAFKKMVMAKLV